MDNSEIFSSAYEYRAVVDTIRVLNIMELANEDADIQLLFAKSRFDYMLDQSPVVFSILSDSDLLQHIKTDSLRRSSAVFFSLAPDTSLDLFMKHLRHLLILHVNGRATVFRYWAAPVWSEIHSKLSPLDLSTLLGPARSIIWFDEEGECHELISDAPVNNIDFDSPYNVTGSLFNNWIKTNER